MACCFFFSSRRRHTRSKRDWSSDVCSSDLQPVDICQRPADDSGGDARPGMVRVPDIVGRSEAEAARLLTAVGLKMGGRTEVKSDKPAGQIVKQLPDANAEVAPGSSVAIEVAARTDRVGGRLGRLRLA